MKYIVDILKQFTQPQRLIVLVVILSAIVLVQYLKTDDCRVVIDENLKMHQDFVTLSEILRKERMMDLEQSTELILDTTTTSELDSTMIGGDVESQILEIIESNIKDLI